MSTLIGLLYCLAADAMLKAGKVPFDSGSSSSSLAPSPSVSLVTSSIVTTGVASTATSPASGPTTVPSGNQGPIPRNFRLQVLSPRINIQWNNKPVTARDDLLFGIDGTVSQTCNATNCDSYDKTTTFTIANGYAQLYNGAGLAQTIYADSRTGALQYAGSAGLYVPKDALRTGLVVRKQSDGTYRFVYNDGQDRGWTGCSERPGYPEYIGLTIVGECMSGMSTGESIEIEAVPVADPGAWAYGPPPRGPCITPRCQ